jgi:hypothetical protein
MGWGVSRCVVVVVVVVEEEAGVVPGRGRRRLGGGGSRAERAWESPSRASMAGMSMPSSVLLLSQ